MVSLAHLHVQVRPMGRTCRWAGEIELTPIVVELNGFVRVPTRTMIMQTNRRIDPYSSAHSGECGSDCTRSARGQRTVSARSARGQRMVSARSAHGQRTVSTRSAHGQHHAPARLCGCRLCPASRHPPVGRLLHTRTSSKYFRVGISHHHSGGRTRRGGEGGGGEGRHQGDDA